MAKWICETAENHELIALIGLVAYALVFTLFASARSKLKEIFMSNPSIGIKETKEALIGINEVGIFIASRVKDGLGLDDAEAAFQKMIGDPEFKAKFVAAYEGAGAIPAEIKDLSILESVELVQIQVSYLPKIKEALSK